MLKVVGVGDQEPGGRERERVRVRNKNSAVGDVRQPIGTKQLTVVPRSRSVAPPESVSARESDDLLVPEPHPPEDLAEVGRVGRVGSGRAGVGVRKAAVGSDRGDAGVDSTGPPGDGGTGH